MNQGLQEGEQAFGVKARSILCCMRHQPSEYHCTLLAAWPSHRAVPILSQHPLPHVSELSKDTSELLVALVSLLIRKSRS